MKIKVTDQQGNPYTGSLVASMYDKSVEYISGGSNVPDIKEFFWKWQRSHNTNRKAACSSRAVSDLQAERDGHAVPRRLRRLAGG